MEKGHREFREFVYCPWRIQGYVLRSNINVSPQIRVPNDAHAGCSGLVLSFFLLFDYQYHYGRVIACQFDKP